MKKIKAGMLHGDAARGPKLQGVRVGRKDTSIVRLRFPCAEIARAAKAVLLIVLALVAVVALRRMRTA